MRSFVKRYKEEDGQTIVLAALAMSIFLFGAIGLAIDGAHMYSQRQMAQTAADAAATAGIYTIYGGITSPSGTRFSSQSSLICAATHTRNPLAPTTHHAFRRAATR